MKKIVLSFLFFTALMNDGKVKAQPRDEPLLVIRDSKTSLSQVIKGANPLECLTIVNARGKNIQVTDGNGNVYVKMAIRPMVNFRVGGALGKHTVTVVNDKGNQSVLFTFNVDAVTDIDDGGYYKKMFNLFYTGMDVSHEYSLSWNGKTYHYFEPWVLDHSQNMMGLKYFKSYGAEMVDLMRQTQRDDGMIYSFVHNEPNVDYFFTRDKISGYTQQIGDKVFTRQPAENHPEYLYVNTIYQCWQAAADDAWMEKNLESASKALDYALHDPARWSKRFGLLKRVYTIDSWDFAVEDEYMPDLGITSSMMIDPEKSKFGIFFGDNTGYISACYELAEMLAHARKTSEAAIYKSRGDELKKRLNALSWNGKYFTHFIDEDSMVVRHLGVDEKSQIAQGNAYSLNRDISADQSKAIIETYLNLKNHLPVGSPGEWYAIYPPFQKGFTMHDAVWQYMNGGVGGHVAGELARGAYANGYEKYGTDILNRLFELGKKYDGKIYFSYTGSIPPPPGAPVFQPLDLTGFANMDNRISDHNGSISWMNASRAGDDFQDLPTGEQVLNGIRFNLINAEKNNHRSVVAVSKSKGLPARMEIPVHKTAACIYLLHTSGKPASENVAGVVIFQYEDGSSKTNYIINGKHLVYWWFSRLKTDYSGIAWYGKNKVSEGIGLSWCAINNPDPDKKIANLIFEAPEGNSIYAIFAITLSDQEHYVPVNPISFGGPDNWAAATAMAAMIEGLAGVKNKPGTQAFSDPVISPRWVTTATDSVNVTIRYAASKGYTAYRFVHSAGKKQISFLATGSGKYLNCHILMPNSISNVKRVSVNNKMISHRMVKIENSWYADFIIQGGGTREVIVSY
jgi:hypothetical protein